jgi:hypothetical protein
MNMNEKKSELNTEKKRNGKIITENENIDEVHSLKRFPLKKLETETNMFDSAKKEPKRIDVKSQTLVIEVISSTLPLGEILRVGPTGLEHGRRKARDGVAFFGYEEEDENVKYFFNASPKWITSFRRRKTSSTGGSTESTSKSASTATT